MRFVLLDHNKRERAVRAIREAPEGYVVTLSPKRRTLNQNALLHDLCAQFGQEIGYTQAEVKDLAKMEVFGPIEREVKGVKLIELKSTADMDTKELGQLIDWIHVRAGEMGVTLYVQE